jgi:hypothetical protein
MMTYVLLQARRDGRDDEVSPCGIAVKTYLGRLQARRNGESRVSTGELSR